MATYTAGDQINRALRLLGVLAEGETPSAETSADALMALNQMIDSWSTERLTVFSTLRQVVAWPAGQSTRTLGPTGNIVATRPVSVDMVYFRDSDGSDWAVGVINQAQYDNIPDKTVTGYPQVVYVNMTHPDAEFTVYPVPDRDLEMRIVSTSELTQPVSLDTELSFPPGYLRAFAYNLALEIAPEFGVEPSSDLRRVAMVSKRDIKRINNPGDLMQMPAALVVRHHGFNISTGE